ncbi:hypothetical protein [Microbacterium sp. 2FI]|uniref:hypothetical protein n=1 Tax=Microbacterium sp. 2FI TaxID=2502193 RepID=UPI0010F84BBA|nr:hypothetical protein [Microbacterium sp. 2FI]
MRSPATSSAAERELRELRLRAYGPHADIDGDPVALARLEKLEAAHALAAHGTPAEELPSSALDSPPGRQASPVALATASVSVGDTPPSRTRPTAGRPRWRAWLIAAALVVILGLAYGGTRLVGDHPEATLRPTGAEPDTRVYRMLVYAPDLRIASSTLRSFGTYRDIDIWAADDAFGNPCLLALDRSVDGLLGAECTPPEGELTMDVGVWPLWERDFGADLPDGSVIRFVHRGDAVEVYHFATGDR